MSDDITMNNDDPNAGIPISTSEAPVVTEQTVSAKLAHLTALRAKIDELESTKDTCLTDEQVAIHKMLTGALRNLYAPWQEAIIHGNAIRATEIALECAVLENEIKAETVAVGHTVRGGSIMAVFTPAGIKWDQKALIGFAAAHPSLNTISTIVPASISMRKC